MTRDQATREAIERIKEGITEEWGFSLTRGSREIARDIQLIIKIAEEKLSLDASTK